ncbi:MAG: glutamine synthetase family protein, partial [Microbacterium sp.]
QGYGDMVLVPDEATLRRVAWIPGSALVMADLTWLDGRPVQQSPRAVLNAQRARLAERGLVAYSGTELEFIVFDDSYRDAWAKGYRGLTAATDYNVDYNLLATTRLEPLLRDIRVSMDAAGMYCEGVKGECNLGQQEIAFRYDEALATADNHVIYKNGAKEIADRHGKAITFMAKFDQREGNSCHIHLSVRSESGDPVMAGDGPHGFSPFMEHWIAGILATLREFTLLYAPTINSYKRYAKGTFAPTGVAWGVDNRTCALRVVGHGSSLRVENRVPGGDVNPYLAIAAIIAGGLHGVEHELALPAPLTGNAYDAGVDRLPTTLGDAAALLDESAIARRAFGDEVVDHYLNQARIEVEAFEAAVTDWERVRGFERL